LTGHLIILAACDGGNLVEVIEPADRAPVCALIGPNRVVNAGEIERASQAFYRTLFCTGSAVTAWRAMNDAIVPDRQTFGVFTAEFTFRYVMFHYFKIKCSEDALAERESSAVARFKQDGWSEPALEYLRQLFCNFLHDLPSQFEQTKKNYFFCDLYPENATRFNVTFEDCLKDPREYPTHGWTGPKTGRSA
jgi:hypothetical protein